MQRRSFLAGIAALAAVRPALGQRVHRVATLVNGTQKAWSGRIEALRGALRALGYAEGRNLTMISYWNDGRLSQLPDLAAELLLEKPDVVVCGPTLAAAAVHTHSRTLPVVQGSGAGLVKIGLAQSFARPGGNVTGIETQTEELTPKHIELLKTIAPAVSRLAVLNTGNYLFHQEAWVAARHTAGVLKLELLDARITTVSDLGRLSAMCTRGACDGLYVLPDPSTINWRKQIVALAAQLKLPAMYFQPEFVHDGGLASYSANIEDTWRRAASYVDRILKGARPAELPIQRPSKFDFLINARTAGDLGLAIPDAVFARADQVIR